MPEKVTTCQDVIQHHHNSRRFNCPCGKFYEWGHLPRKTYGPAAQITCECGRVHWKELRGFGGEGARTAGSRF